MLGHLDVPWAKILMRADTSYEKEYRLRAASKEPWTTSWILSMRDGSVFWDIGANVGSYTLMAAARQIRVYAFEPAPQNYATLCRNIMLNPHLMKMVTPLALAVSDETSIGHMAFTSLDSGSASHIWGSGVFSVPSVTATDAIAVFGISHPDYIKIDVDGAEDRVINGVGTLAREIMIECQDDAPPSLPQGFARKEQWPSRGGIHYELWVR